VFFGLASQAAEEPMETIDDDNAAGISQCDEYEDFS
jgi:hypothetical protein